jgi:hypothetical protein
MSDNDNEIETDNEIEQLSQEDFDKLLNQIVFAGKDQEHQQKLRAAFIGGTAFVDEDGNLCIAVDPAVYQKIEEQLSDADEGTKDE